MSRTRSPTSPGPRGSTTRWCTRSAAGASSTRRVASATAPAGHVALSASGRRAVDAAHAAGLAAGGRDAGAPAPRPYGPPNYYSGYLVDPDGVRLELVSGSR